MFNLTFPQKIYKRFLKSYSFLFLICFIAPAAWAEGPYYIKNGGDDNAAGTSDATAWATLENVDKANFADGTDIYFKQNNVFTISDSIDINWSGVNYANRSIIGCYESTGDFNCSGAKPVIQQSSQTPPVFRFLDSEYLTFQDLELKNIHASWEDSGSEGIASQADMAKYGSGNSEYGYLIIDNCDFYHFGHYAIALAQMGNYNVITNNTFNYCGNAIYFIDESNAGSSYNYIADNTCENIVGYNSGSGKRDGHCVGLQRTSYTIVRGNSSTSNYSGAYVLWTGVSFSGIYNIFANNTSYGSEKAAMIVSGGGDANSYGNLCYDNILTDSGISSVRQALRFDHMMPGYQGNRAFHNTIYNARSGGIGLKDNTDYTYWKNNIVHTDGVGASDQLFRFETDGGGGDNLVIDNNLYWTAVGSPVTLSLWEDTNDKAYKWNDWKALGGNDTKSITPSDPQFKNPSKYDFSLSSQSSPAYDSGDYLSYVISTSGTSITVADSYWFHGNFGLFDSDGRPITGMEITFYDGTYGLQHRIITSDFINHGTPGTFEINESIKSIYNASHLRDPKYTTQVSLKFLGKKPDIGAKEYGAFSKPIVPTPMSPPSNFKRAHSTLSH